MILERTCSYLLVLLTLFGSCEHQYNAYIIIMYGFLKICFANYANTIILTYHKIELNLVLIIKIIVSQHIKNKYK